MQKKHISTISLLLSVSLLQTTIADQNDDFELKALESKLEHAMTQTGMNVSSGKVAAYLERKIKGIEAELIGSLSGERKERFSDSCTEWEEWKQTTVALEASVYEGGSIKPLIYNSARINLAKERIKNLELIRNELLEEK